METKDKKMAMGLTKWSTLKVLDGPPKSSRKDRLGFWFRYRILRRGL